MSGLRSVILSRGIAAALLLPCALPVSLLAHDAPSGWSYPYACCSDKDCRQVPASTISERPEGYLIRATGEVVSYSDRRVKTSPDGVYHRCSVAGKEGTRTICLFVPPKLF